MYTIKDHGDLLEKQAAEFITLKLPHYEKVWSLYVGNRGNATKADLPGYPDDGKRTHFAENSYTALESLFMINEILDTGVFMKTINSFALYKEFNTAFITFFAHVGRSLDMMKKNSILLKCNEVEFRNDVDRYYQGRNIVLHGKKVPFVTDSDGQLLMPKLRLDVTAGTGWEDGNYRWSMVAAAQTEYVEDNIRQFFDGLLALVETQYARFYNSLKGELKALNTALIFQRIAPQAFPALDASGSTGVDVYHLKEAFAGRDPFSRLSSPPDPSEPGK